MSNTPRTDDNLWVSIHGCFKTKNTGGKGYVPETISRELETELAVANDRIKRLEEAGDAMDPMNDTECECDSGYVVVCKHCFDRSTNWRKAKEAKP